MYLVCNRHKKTINVEEVWLHRDCSSPTDVGSNNSGFYELVLTHQGRSSSSGHYVGWVVLKNGGSHDIT